jgi:hypothetical protein
MSDDENIDLIDSYGPVCVGLLPFCQHTDWFVARAANE